MLVLLAVLPGHVTALPVWVSYLAAVAVLVPMAAVALTAGNTLWLGIERTMIILLATAYVANTIAELADMIGVITTPSVGQQRVFASFFIGGDLGGQRSDLLFAVLANRSRRSVCSGEQVGCKAGLGLSATGETGRPAARLAAVVPRLSISWIQHGDGFQSHRCLAAYASRQDVDDDRKHDLAFDDGHYPVTRHQYSPELKGRGLTKWSFCGSFSSYWTQSPIDRFSILY